MGTTGSSNGRASAADGVLGRSLGYLPFIMAAVLLAAALFKGLELATTELSEAGLLSSRWFLASLVLFEIGLAIWLLSGLHIRATSWLLLFTFLAFFETALYLALAGYGSCKCLGRYSVSPWVAASFDAVAVCAIAMWQPLAAGPTIFSHPVRFAIASIVFVLAAFPALVSIVNYTPIGQMPHLRNALELGVRIKMDQKNPTADEFVGALQTATGLAISVDDRLAQGWSSFGEIKTNGVPAWALMELLAHHQAQPARWKKEDGGYRLVPSSPMGARVPWLISAVGLLVTGAYLLYSRSRGR